MIKLPVFKKEKCSYSYNNLNFPSLKENKNCKIFLRLHHAVDCTTVSQTNHTCSPTPRFARFPICNDIFPTFGKCRFFYLWDRSWNSDECVQKFHYSFVLNYKDVGELGQWMGSK